MMLVKGKNYTIYSIITSLVWEVILAVVVLKLLPRYGVSIPLWALIVLMALLGIYSCLGYWLGKKAISKKPLVSVEVFIGTKCKTVTLLKPKGYIRLGGELWQARAESDISADEEVTVVGVEGMTMLVSPSDGSGDCETI